MNILVTGATGFIGQHLVPELLHRRHSVTAVARDQNKAAVMPWIDKVTFIACDLYDSSLGFNKRLGTPDLLIHLAWPGLPNYKALYHLERNLPADYLFLKAMLNAGTGRMLVTGTCFEYGIQYGPLAEDAPTFPANPYGLAKDTLRRFLQVLQAERSFVLQWARLFYLYGPGQNPNSLLAQLDQTIERGDTVFNMSGGEQLRDYLPVQEVARRLALLVEHPEYAGVVNCCSGKPISVRRLVEQRIAERGANIALNLGYYPYPDHEPMAFWGVSTRFSCIDFSPND